MSVYAEVNTNLQINRYLHGMKMKRGRPGSPKGQPKPAKRALDPDFPKRLNGAFALRPGLTVPQLAAEVGCTRAVLHKYLNGNSKAIEALLLYKLADALSVSARWLLTGEGAVARNASLTPDQPRVLETFNRFKDEGLRDFWISQGEDLLRRQPPLTGTPHAYDGPDRRKSK